MLGQGPDVPLLRLFRLTRIVKMVGAYNRLVKMRFDSAGIEIPFPHTTLYFGQDKSGSAPPANLRVMQQDFTIDGSPAGQPKRAELEVDDRHRPRRGKSPSAQEAEHHKPDDEDV